MTKTERKSKTYRIDLEYVDLLDHINQSKQQSPSDIINQALALYFNKIEPLPLTEKVKLTDKRFDNYRPKGLAVEIMNVLTDKNKKAVQQVALLREREKLITFKSLDLIFGKIGELK